MSGLTPPSTNLVTGDMIGETVTFSSKNPTDPTTYLGMVVAVIDPALAPNFGADLTAYNAAVQRADPAVGAIAYLHYFVIRLQNNQSPPQNRVFANEWIALASFSVIQQATVYTFNVYDLPNNGEAAILALLRTNGYNAVLVTPS